MNIDDESVTTLDDLKGDLALRYKWTPSGGTSVDRAIVELEGPQGRGIGTVEFVSFAQEAPPELTEVAG